MEMAVADEAVFAVVMAEILEVDSHAIEHGLRIEKLRPRCADVLSRFKGSNVIATLLA